jgi:predicted aldo/keto reductase-like oxidoreductase
MIAYAHSKGLGTVAMGPVGGGRLAAPTELYTKLGGKESRPTYELALKFCLGNPNLSCALSGMQTLEMVEKNVNLASNSADFSAEEWKTLGENVEKLKKFNELYCTGCGYCQPCPAEIKIPHIFGIYTNYNVYELKDHARGQYKRYTEHDHGHTAADCIDCGQCEDKCPQSLPIREALRKVDDALR